MSLVVVGLSHRTAPVALLEVASVGPDDLPGFVSAAVANPHVAEAVVVAMATIATAANSIAARRLLIFSWNSSSAWTGRCYRDVRMPRIVSAGSRRRRFPRRARIAAPTMRPPPGGTTR